MPAPRAQITTLTVGEKQRIAKAVTRANQLPRGSLRGPSTYKPGTPLLLGVLNTELTYAIGYTDFKIWAAPTPDNNASTETELASDEYPDQIVHNWTFLKADEKLESGSRIIVGWIAGRWYLLDGPCPISTV